VSSAINLNSAFTRIEKLVQLYKQDLSVPLQDDKILRIREQFKNIASTSNSLIKGDVNIAYGTDEYKDCPDTLSECHDEDGMSSNDAISPQILKKRIQKKSKTSAIRSEMSLTKVEQAILITIDSDCSDFKKFELTALSGLRNIAKLHKGRCYPTLYKAMKDMDFRKKVFDQAYNHCFGYGYTFNRVNLAGSDKCEDRPYTLVKYDKE
jgi:hypothetical protein